MRFRCKEINLNHSSDLKEGEDYYLDSQGNLVFTEIYHLKRGYCCQNGCKHCPFQYIAD